MAQTTVSLASRKHRGFSLIEVLVAQEGQVLPICDGERRIQGLVSAESLLRSLHAEILSREEPKERETDAG